MRRWTWIGSWKRLALQAGVLAGLGLAFVGGGQAPVRAGGNCGAAAMCDFKKPNLMFVLDYSSSMNEEFVAGQTAWEAAIEAIENVITTDCGFFAETLHLSLMRFGHDPDPDTAGTVIAGLVDGQALDVHWYDPADDPQGWHECNGQQIVDALDAVPPPLCLPGGAPPSGCAGMGSWTNGALLEAGEIIAQTRLDHPSDLDPGDERIYALLLLTNGPWTGAAGSPLQPADQNPAVTAGQLYNENDVMTYVVAFGDAVGMGFPDEIALAGGTGAAIQPGAGQLLPAIEDVVDDLLSQVIFPPCPIEKCVDEGTTDGGSSSTGDETTTGSTTTGEPRSTTTGGSAADSGPGVIDSSGAIDSSGGADETASAGASSATPPGPMTTTMPPDGGESGSQSDTDTDGSGAITINGCSCTAHRDASPAGWLGLVSMLGLLGLRRRAARVSPRARGTR